MDRNNGNKQMGLTALSYKRTYKHLFQIYATTIWFANRSKTNELMSCHLLQIHVIQNLHYPKIYNYLDN